MFNTVLYVALNLAMIGNMAIAFYLDWNGLPGREWYMATAILCGVILLQFDRD